MTGEGATVPRMLLDEAGDVAALSRDWCERGLSDGLPIVPPTVERVAAMVDGSGLSADEVVGVLVPRYGVATVEKIAVQAVMAGCVPEYMPVICSVIRAMSREPFDLRGLQTTTHPAGACVIVNGPVRAQLGFNSRDGCLGPGSHANATVGRAVRLCLMNIGGALPGQRDMSTHGHAGKFTYCFAENEEENPWGPLHVDLGYEPGDSTVTVISGAAPHNIYDSIADSPEHILFIAADVLTSLGSNNVWGLKTSEIHLVLGPEHASTIHGAGWSKDDVRSYLFQHARRPLSVWRRGGAWGAHIWPHWLDDAADDELVPVVSRPDRILITVAGGVGKHSFWIPTMSVAVSATEKVNLPPTEEASS